MLNRLIKIGLLSATLAGCGLKGGLYLPPGSATPNTTSATPTTQNPSTPASEKPASP
ncbi:MAG: lipoprotein [Betaproteobacteria bacterium]|nr:lipoprotein [Betaproteobacteria bacterium]